MASNLIPFSDPALLDTVIDAESRETLRKILEKTDAKELTPDFYQAIHRIAKSARNAANTMGERQATKAIKYVIDSTQGQHSAGEIIALFDELLTIKSEAPYTGNSVGIEVEFGADNKDGASQARELRLGPFTDNNTAMEALRRLHAINNLCGDTAMSTIHLNFGLTQRQKSEIAEPQIVNVNCQGFVHFLRKPFFEITQKLGYLTNSAARNIKVGGNYHIEDVPPHCSDDGPIELTPRGYYRHNQYRGDFIKNDIRLLDGNVATPQIARLESKGYSLSRDADVNLLEPIIDVMWKILDEPATAERLNADLNQIFKDAEIHIFRDHRTYQGDEDKDNFTHEEKLYMHDFGMTYPVPSEGAADELMVLGRQTAWREPIHKYLESFIQGQAEIPYALYPAKEELAAYSELVSRWEAMHPKPADKIWTKEIERAGKQNSSLIIPRI